MSKFLFFLISLFFIGCIHTQYNVNQTFPKKSVSVIPFVNFTQTPLAGYRVAGIFEGVLKSKGCHIKYSLFSFPQRDYSIDELKYLIKKGPKAGLHVNFSDKDLEKAIKYLNLK